MQNSGSEHTTGWTLKMAYSTRRPHRCHFCQLRTRKWGYYCAGTKVDQKNFNWSEESECQLRNSNDLARIWCKQHANISHTILGPLWAPQYQLSNCVRLSCQHGRKSWGLFCHTGVAVDLLLPLLAEESKICGGGNKWLIIFFFFFN